MKKQVLLLGVVSSLLAAMPAFATNTYDSANYRCDELKKIVQDERVVLIRHPMGCNRYFADESLCDRYTEEAYLGYLISSDEFFCKVGYVCRKKKKKIEEI